VNTQAVKSYIRDEVETIAPREMAKLQVARLREGVESIEAQTTWTN
jgi:hypothetical protein